MMLTRRQKEVFDFIKSFIESHGFAPSYDEIARGLGLRSISTVHKHVDYLARKGKITTGGNMKRSIEIVPEGKTARFRFDGPRRLYDTMLQIYWVPEERKNA